MAQINIHQQIVIRALLDLCSSNRKTRDETAQWVRTSLGFNDACERVGLDPTTLRKFVGTDLMQCEDLARRRSMVDDAISAFTALS